LWIDPLWCLLHFALHPHAPTNQASIKSLTFFFSDNNQQQSLQMIAVPTMAQHAPDHIIFGPQNLEQPADSPRAKTFPWKAARS